MANGTPRIGRPPRPVPPGTKWCPRCEQALPLDAFGKHASQPSGLTAHCRACHRLVGREWDAKNPGWRAAYKRERRAQNIEVERRRDLETYYRRKERDYEGLRAVRKAWEAKNRDRLRHHNRENTTRRRRLMAGSLVPFMADQLHARLAFFGFECWICGAPYEAVDHVKPLAKGGAHMLANLRPICRSCNSSKRAKWPFPTRWRRGEAA